MLHIYTLQVSYRCATWRVLLGHGVSTSTMIVCSRATPYNYSQNHQFSAIVRGFRRKQRSRMHIESPRVVSNLGSPHVVARAERLVPTKKRKDSEIRNPFCLHTRGVGPTLFCPFHYFEAGVPPSQAGDFATRVRVKEPKRGCSDWAGAHFDRSFHVNLTRQLR
ncbi:hypothetical protein TorRG33x02_095980 [Trema orientale]|uniref:Uncharacterized protein n=1 Tax=Trema orientale TaxID=63057 RepID=A0A2P5F9V8_TREOI|nr:hypothetical protein TorRG33x02_095980 [Trema orientale]